MDEAVWDEVVALNLKSVYLGARAAIRRMLPRGKGVVVSTASGTGIRGQAKGSAYAASKAGIIGFTRAVSLELKDTGVRINCFGPGATDTPLLASVPERHRESLLRVIPFRRFADVRGKMGEVTEVTAESIKVTAQGGQVEILRVKPEDGKKDSAGVFAAAAGLVAGAFLGT